MLFGAWQRQIWYNETLHTNAPPVLATPSGRHTGGYAPMLDQSTTPLMTCSKCSEAKPLSEFLIKDRAIGRRSASCRGCDSARKRATYQKKERALKPTPAAKRCTQCGEVKDVSEFAPRRDKPHRTLSHCKACTSPSLQKTIPRICAVCGVEFSTSPRGMKEAMKNTGTGVQHCSSRCHLAAIAPLLKGPRVDRIRRVCEQCGKSFEIPPAAFRKRLTHGDDSRMYCSKACVHRHNNPWWCEGVRYERGRTQTARWQRTRRAVIKRDGHACVRCGSDCRLEVHHIIPWHMCFDDAPENLMTLCRLCHPIVERETWKLLRRYD